MSTKTKFEIIEKIGVGGMGELYRARLFNDSGFEKIVAAKKVHGVEISQGLAAQKGLVQEASIQSLLNHPNICSILDIREFQGDQYILVEYIEGKSINDLQNLAIQKSYKFSEDFIWIILQNAIQGLEYLHSSSAAKPAILHRDLSPHNIMVGNQGFIKIIDFGVSGFLNKKEKNTGDIAFKMRYVAPEILHGEQYSEQSDLYALGIIIYELATGIKAFGGTLSKSQSNVFEELDYTLVSQRGYSSHLQIVIQKLANSNVSKRYKNAQEVKKDITIQLNESNVIINELNSISSFSLDFTKTIHIPVNQKKSPKLNKVFVFLVLLLVFGSSLIFQLYNKYNRHVPVLIQVNTPNGEFKLDLKKSELSKTIVGQELGYSLSEQSCVTVEKLLIGYPRLLFNKDLNVLIKELNLSHSPHSFLYSVQNRIEADKNRLKRIYKSCSHHDRFSSLANVLSEMAKNISKVSIKNIQSFEELQEIVLSISTIGEQKFMEIDRKLLQINEVPQNKIYVEAADQIKEFDIISVSNILLLSLNESIFPQDAKTCREMLDLFWVKKELQENLASVFTVVLVPFPLDAEIQAYDKNYLEFTTPQDGETSDFKTKGACVYQRVEGELTEISLRRLK